jgi:hypothetical protein
MGDSLTGDCPQFPEIEIRTMEKAKRVLEMAISKIRHFNACYPHCQLINPRIVTNAESGMYTAKCYRRKT